MTIAPAITDQAALCPPITLFNMLETIPDQRVQTGQGVEGYGGERVVLSVIGHIPGQPTDRRPGADGAGIAPDIGYCRTAAML